jgi:hypothetical protein
MGHPLKTRPRNRINLSQLFLFLSRPALKARSEAGSRSKSENPLRVTGAVLMFFAWCAEGRCIIIPIGVALSCVATGGTTGVEGGYHVWEDPGDEGL